MGKRSNFERVERDFYPTPIEAVRPLLPHLLPKTRFIEPCAGDGALISHLERYGYECAMAWDIEPKRQDIWKLNALTEIARASLSYDDFSCFITNPPWDRRVLHPLILHLSTQAPTWLLFDADWAHTRQAIHYLPRLRKIVAVGRVKWIPDSPFTGKDNCAWHLFDNKEDGGTLFFGRTPDTPEDVSGIELDDLL